jgi:hypothetical protein
VPLLQLNTCPFRQNKVVVRKINLRKLSPSPKRNKGAKRAYWRNWKKEKSELRVYSSVQEVGEHGCGLLVLPRQTVGQRKATEWRTWLVKLGSNLYLFELTTSKLIMRCGDFLLRWVVTDAVPMISVRPNSLPPFLS